MMRSRSMTTCFNGEQPKVVVNVQKRMSNQEYREHGVLDCSGNKSALTMMKTRNAIRERTSIVRKTRGWRIAPYQRMSLDYNRKSALVRSSISLFS
jgi:hypothetical protein